MPLIKPMILVITFALSNGGQITYELSDSMFTCRQIVTDEDEGFQDFLEITIDWDDFSHSFDAKNFGYKRRKKINGSFNTWNDKIDEGLTEEFVVDRYKGIKLEHEILNDSRVIFYFVQINELDSLIKKSKYLELEIVKDNYLYVFPDFVIEDAQGVEIETIDVEWKENFSEYVRIKLDIIQSDKGK